MSTESVRDVSAALGRVVELFGAICAAPDDLDLARDADQSLAELNRLLAQEPGPGR